MLTGYILCLNTKDILCLVQNSEKNTMENIPQTTGERD